MSQDRLAIIALQRFGLGPNSRSIKAISHDPRAALLAEIRSDALALVDKTLPNTARAIQMITEIEERRRVARAAQRTTAQAAGAAPAQQMAAGQMPPAMEMQPSAAVPSANAPAAMMRDPDEVTLQDVMNAETRARLEHGIAQTCGFAERWVMFWSNHFCVATRRGQIMRSTVGAYERETIRAHAFGKFHDLLAAVETHPAMLHYLDQRQSIGPNSPMGKRRERGLNENLAREILELHTLGVGGGYSQADVTSFAKILTGWSITGFDENIDGYGGFLFAPNRHEPGAHKVMGKSYEQDGKAQGLAVLADLASHPSTAKFIATKLAKHFVADAPPPQLVAKLERNFKETKGDLASLAKTLLNADEAWAAPAKKLKTPAEFVISVFRATAEKPDRPQQVLNALNQMGQPLWNPTGPNGHPDDEASIAAPKAIKTRLDYAQSVARPVAARLDPRELASELFGTALSSETRQAIARAETRPQGLAILLMSPEFQRR